MNMAKSDEMILGENCVYSMDSRRTGLNNNVIVCGTSGCGKTMSISEPKLLHTFDTSLIVTVTKNRLVQKYRGALAQLGYEVMDLNFVSPDRSDTGYDPLRNVRNYQDVRFCARSIVMGNSRKEGNTTADPYWDEIAISLLCAIIAKTMMTDRNATLADVLDAFDRLSIKDDGSSIKTTLDEEFAALEKRNPHGWIGHVCIECRHIDEVVADFKARGIIPETAQVSYSDKILGGIKNIFFDGPSGEAIELFDYLKD